MDRWIDIYIYIYIERDIDIYTHNTSNNDSTNTNSGGRSEKLSPSVMAQPPQSMTLARLARLS